MCEYLLEVSGSDYTLSQFILTRKAIAISQSAQQTQTIFYSDEPECLGNLATVSSVDYNGHYSQIGESCCFRMDGEFLNR